MRARNAMRDDDCDNEDRLLYVDEGCETEGGLRESRIARMIHLLGYLISASHLL